MNLWRGVPDLSRPEEILGYTLFPAGDAANLFVYLPGRLEVAPRENAPAELDFSIESVHGQNPFKPPQSYGVLDFRLHAAPFSAEAFEALRQKYPGASLTPALFRRGWLRLVSTSANESTSDGATNSDALQAPVALASNGLDATRYIRRLAQDEVSLLRRVLQEATLTYSAVAEMEIEGLTDHVPARLDFSPAALLAALQALADAQGCLACSKLVDFWMQDVAHLPVTPLEGFDTIDRARLAHTLADWTLAEYAVCVPSPVLPAVPTCQLQPPQPLPDVVRWDLHLDKLVPHVVLLTLDPFDAARQVVAANGLESVLTETVVPTLETGVVSLTVAANLPDNLQGVLHMGVNLLAPPTPPQRVHPLTAGLMFDDPQARQTVNWQFSPVEEEAYQYTTFVFVRQAGSIRRYEGQPTAHRGPYLLLSVADFPLGFVPVKASVLLLSQALIQGVCRYPDAQTGADVTLPFELNSAQPAVTLTLPAAVLPQATIHLQACALQGQAMLTLGDSPARGLSLDLLNLREYGPHAIQVTLEFDVPGVVLVALELLPEATGDQPAQAGVIALTPDSPQATWRYFAASPFQAGYQYRRRAEDGAPPVAWSAVQSPFEALKLKVSQL